MDIERLRERVEVLSDMSESRNAVRFWDSHLSDLESSFGASPGDYSKLGFAVHSLCHRKLWHIIADFAEYEGVPELKKKGISLFCRMMETVNSKEWLKTNIGESKNPVFTFEGAEHLIVVKSSEDMQELVDEDETTRIYASLDEYETFGRIVEPILVSDRPVNGKYFFVTRREKAQTLYDFMEGKDFIIIDDVIKRAMDFMSFLHSNYDGPTKGSLNLYEKLKKNLFDPNLGIDPLVAGAILSDINPLLEILIDSIFVHNMDSHPENFLIKTPYEFIRADCARGHEVPCELELANLLMYKYIRSEEELCERIHGKDALSVLIDHYCSTTTQSFDEVLPRFYAATILRSFALASAWSDPGRKSMHSSIPGILANSDIAMIQLARNCPKVYDQNRSRYSRLSDNFWKVFEKAQNDFG